MRNKLFAVLATIAVAMVLGASSARADQISLGDSCSGTFSVTVTNPPTVSSNVTGCHGTWEQGSTDTSITPWSYDGTTFTVSDSGVNTMTGTINWTAFIEGSSTLQGWLTVDTVTGFNGEYSENGTYWIDITFQPGSCSYDEQTRTYTGCRVSSGEVPVPEPGTLTLLGTGLLTMAGFLRRKLSA